MLVNYFKVIPGKSIAAEHIVLVMEYNNDQTEQEKKTTHSRKAD